MIATLQFDLNSEKERREWEIVRQAVAMHSACLLIDNALRAESQSENRNVAARGRWARKLFKSFLDQERADLWP